MRAARVLLFCLPLLPLPALAAHGGDEPELVVLGEPRPPAGVATSTGRVTLTYRVLEVFAGEPGSASVVVRHDQLDPTDRIRLASADRLIVMARRDAQEPGRWVASAPLAATDQAVDAFRRWSAPADVRAERPLSDVLAEVDDPASAPPPRAKAPAERPTSAPTPQASAPTPHASAPTPGAPPESRAAPEADPIGDVSPRSDAPAPRAKIEPATPAPRTTAEPPAPAPRERIAQQEPQGPLAPGLPPDPSSRPLGPSLDRRWDLQATR